MANKVISFERSQAGQTLQNGHVYTDIGRYEQTKKERKFDPIHTSEFVDFLCEKYEDDSIREKLQQLVSDVPTITQYNERNICDDILRRIGSEHGDFSFDVYIAFRTEDQKYVSRLVDVQAVQNSLKQIFQWVPGERVINPEFGSRLRYLLYEQITSRNEEAINAEIRQSITIWEPRVDITKIVNSTTPQDRDNNTVHVDIYYKIKGLDGQEYRYSYIYDRAGSK